MRNVAGERRKVSDNIERFQIVQPNYKLTTHTDVLKEIKDAVEPLCSNRTFKPPKNPFDMIGLYLSDRLKSRKRPERREKTESLPMKESPLSKAKTGPRTIVHDKTYKAQSDFNMSPKTV